MLATFVIEPSAAENAPLIAAGVAAGLHWRGGTPSRAAARRGTRPPERIARERARTAAFALALVALVLALQQPIDSYADRLLWMHMVQHVLLLTVIPPLLLLAAPWMRLWRGLPLRLRRPLARWAVRGRTAAPLRGLAHVLARPTVAWLALTADVVGWHLPGAYDLALRSQGVHDAEHVTFLLFALLAWGQVIDSPPLRSVLDHPRRIAFAVASMVSSWALAIALAFAARPWYGYYVHLRRGGISPLTDQHLAGGIMWVPGSLTWSLTVFVLLYRWLRPYVDPEQPRAQPVRPVAAGPRNGGPVPVPARVIPVEMETVGAVAGVGDA